MGVAMQCRLGQTVSIIHFGVTLHIMRSAVPLDFLLDGQVAKCCPRRVGQVGGNSSQHHAEILFTDGEERARRRHNVGL